MSAGDPAAVRRAFALRDAGAGARRGLSRVGHVAWRAIGRRPSCPGRVGLARGRRNARSTPLRD